MIERPILFSGPMVRAILAGQKTQTRRPVKDAWKPGIDRHWMACDPSRAASVCPYGSPGDRLYVREAFRYVDEFRQRVAYRADGEPPCGRVRWKPGIHLPRCHSRLLLEVTEVRVERLQQITEEDARAEGFAAETRVTWSGYDPVCDGYVDCLGEPRPGQLENVRRHERTTTAVEAFSNLWRRIHAGSDFTWESNPWVWVVSFTRAEG